MTALVFVDGFDKYGPTGNQNMSSVLSGDWSTVVGVNNAIVAPLSTSGYALLVAANSSITSTIFTASTRIAGSFRISSTLAGQARIGVQNGASAAFGISLETTGVIALRTGIAASGTIINSGGSIGANTTHVISFDVTVGASSAYAVYLDGVALFSGTGNTGNGQTSVNTLFLSNGASGVFTIDDLALFNPADAAYNSAVLTNNAVVETSYPSGDAQKQFTNDGNVLWPTGIAANGVYVATSSATADGTGANILFLLKVTPVVNCTLNSVSTVSNATASTAKIRAAVYTDNAGAPNTLLSTGPEVIGITLAVTMTGMLTTPQALVAGIPYWIGFITDTSLSLRVVDATTNLGRRIAATYTSGAPGTAGAMTSGRATWWIWGNCTGAATNYASEMLNPPLGTAQSQVRSSTVAQEDLYTFPALTTTPSAIYGVAVKGFLAKSDSGARTVSLNMKSAASDSTGSAPSQAMSTTSQWQRSHFDVDPATGVAWTAAGLNAASSGVSVAS